MGALTFIEKHESISEIFDLVQEILQEKFQRS